MGKKINLQGQTFGRLLVLEECQKRTSNGYVTWLCECECGTKCTVSSFCLRNSQTRSCGCLFLESVTRNGQSKRVHGQTNTKTYNTWLGMKGRCTNPNNPNFKDYGGRGIQVCDRWMSFDLFLQDMGECPSEMTIERKDVNGNYEPDNCEWATQKQQQNNRRNNVRLDFMGQSMTISQWSEKTGLNEETIGWRIRNGWPVASALTNKAWGRGLVRHD